MNIDDVVTEHAVTKVVVAERTARDRSEWTAMHATYAHDSVVHLSWYLGDGPGFVDQSARMHDERSWQASHLLGPVLVRASTGGDKAVAEAGVAIAMRQTLDSVDVDVTSYGRLLYRIGRSESGWRITHLTMIYDHDTLAPAMPGVILHLDDTELTRYRLSYRYLSYVAEHTGGHARTDLPGVDRPELVAATYESANAWLSADA